MSTGPSDQRTLLPDVHCFTEENIRRQLETAAFTLGFYSLRFYTQDGQPVNRVTDTVEEYFLYPSGGTLRDSKFNIILYDSRFDTYRGFKPPHLSRPQE
jgi:hypothetical protein